ncbi:hypothetical protein KBC75_04410 [Candidatus Shapirobacteria bacterium]|nr:hypothetical protein [Candidatus Shapirobacteria bacterium]
MNRQIIRYYWTALCLVLGIAYMIGNTSVDYRINAQYTPTPDPNSCSCIYQCTDANLCLASVTCRNGFGDLCGNITYNVSNLSCCAVPTGTTACNALVCYPMDSGLGGCPGGSGSSDDCGGVSCSPCPGSETPTPGSGGGATSAPVPTTIPGCTQNCAAQACRANTCTNQTCLGTCGEYCYGTLSSTSSVAPVLGTPLNNANMPVGTVTLRWGAPSSWGTCPGTQTFDLCVSTSSSSPCTTGVAITDLPPSQLSYDYTFSTPGTYYWEVVADNGTGLPATASTVYTIVINELPALSSLTLYNSHNIQVPWDVGVGISGRGQIQNSLFTSDSSPRTVVYSFDISDANGWSDITTAQMSWNGNVDNLTISNGSGVNAKAKATINYPNSANDDGLYPIKIRMVDGGGDTGWFDTGYYFKVWDGVVTVTGIMYDSSAESLGAVASTGAGFTVLAPPDMNFTSVGVTNFSSGTGFTAPVIGAGSPGVLSGVLTGTLTGTTLVATVSGSVSGGSITGALAGTTLNGTVVGGVLVATVNGTVNGTTLSGTVTGTVTGGGVVTANVLGTLGGSAISGTLTGSVVGGVVTGNVSASVTGASIGGNTFTLTLNWGNNYLVTPNASLAGSNVVTRWTDVGAGTINSGPQRIVDLTTVDPYFSNVDLKIDFSAVRNQTPWYQVFGSGLNASGTIGNMIPVTCGIDPGCDPAIVVETSAGEANNGMVSATTITNNSGCSITDPASSCKFGLPNNWYRQSNTLLAKDNLNYSFFYNKYFVGLGLGTTLASGAKMSTISGIGGTGVIFVNGDFTIDTDNTLTVGKSLVIIAKGTISIDQSVNAVAGVFMADGGISVTGDGTMLTVEGSMFSSGGNIRLNRDLGGTSNNVSPGVKIVYRPDLVLNLPGPMLKVLSSWRTGQ